eukprot:748639-Hanusia_phi.AAC.3
MEIEQFEDLLKAMVDPEKQEPERQQARQIVENILDCVLQTNISHDQRKKAEECVNNLSNPVNLNVANDAVLAQSLSDNFTRKQIAIQKRLAQLQYILDHSTSHYAQAVACNSLSLLVTNNWNEKMIPYTEIKNYALSFLFAHASDPNCPPFVKQGMVRLFSRVCRLCRVSNGPDCAIMNDLSKMFETSVEHFILGMRILLDYVEEIVAKSGEVSFLHRRMFFYSDLTTILKFALESVRKYFSNMSSENDKMLLNSSLELTVRCLSSPDADRTYDKDEMDLGRGLILAKWSPFITQMELIDMFIVMYGSLDAPISTRALTILLFISSLRPGMYRSIADFQNATKGIIMGIGQILKNRKDLDHPDNLDIFCRFLSEFGQVCIVWKYLPKNECNQFIEMASSLTLAILRELEPPANSVYHLLHFWCRLAVSEMGRGRSSPRSPELQIVHEEIQEAEDSLGDLYDVLERTLPAIVYTYITGRIECISAAASGGADNPLEDVDSLENQLELIPILCTIRYEKIGAQLFEMIDHFSNLYEAAFSSSNQVQVEVLEMQIAWMIRLCSAIVGGHYTVRAGSFRSFDINPIIETTLQEGEELVDAELIGKVFRLMMLIQRRISVSNTQDKCDYRLELAVLTFLEKLKLGLLYVDRTLSEQKEESTSIPEYLPSFLRRLVIRRPKPILTQEMHIEIFKRIGFNDHMEVINMMISKLLENLQVWGHNSMVIKETLHLLGIIIHGTSGEGTLSMLLEIDTIKRLMKNHAAVSSSFLNYPANAKNRTMYYLTITQLFLLEEDDAEASGSFETFLEPTITTLVQLKNTANLRTDEARFAIIGVSRDLRGITCATDTKLFHVLFDMMFPACQGVFARCLECWADDPAVCIAVLKMWMEIASNARNRISFDAGIPAGLVVFKEMALTIIVYCRYLLSKGPSTGGMDPYNHRYKCIGICMLSMTLALSGEYVGFGAFSMYGDSVVEDVFKVLVQVGLSIPQNDILAYHKVAISFYSCIEAMFKHAISIVIGLETVEVTQLLQVGLDSVVLFLCMPRRSRLTWHCRSFTTD